MNRLKKILLRFISLILVLISFWWIAYAMEFFTVSDWWNELVRKINLLVSSINSNNRAVWVNYTVWNFSPNEILTASRLNEIVTATNNAAAWISNLQSNLTNTQNALNAERKENMMYCQVWSMVSKSSGWWPATNTYLINFPGVWQSRQVSHIWARRNIVSMWRDGRANTACVNWATRVYTETYSWWAWANSYNYAIQEWHSKINSVITFNTPSIWGSHTYWWNPRWWIDICCLYWSDWY